MMDSTEPGMPVGAVTALGAVVLLAFTSMGIVIPVLPVFIRQRLHGSDALIGTVMGMHAAVAVIGRPTTGRLVARHGPRPVLLLGAGLLSVGALACILADRLAFVLLARLVIGIGDACVMISGAGWLLVLAPESRRGRALALFGLTSWAGLSIGPILGSGALQRSYFAAWLAASAAALASLSGALLLKAPPGIERASSDLAFIPRGVVRPGISLALGSAAYAVLPAFIVLMLLNHRSERGGAVLAVAGTAFIATRVLAGSLFDKPDHFGLAARGALVEAMGLALIAVAARTTAILPMTLLGAGLVGSGASVLYPSLGAVALTGASKSDRATVIGAFTACSDLGLALGASLMGWVSSLIGYDGAYFAAALVALLCAFSCTLGHDSVPGRGARVRYD